VSVGQSVGGSAICRRIHGCPIYHMPRYLHTDAWVPTDAMQPTETKSNTATPFLTFLLQINTGYKLQYKCRIHKYVQ
jgi:hypothetical protein